MDMKEQCYKVKRSNLCLSIKEYGGEKLTRTPAHTRARPCRVIHSCTHPNIFHFRSQLPDPYTIAGTPRQWHSLALALPILARAFRLYHSQFVFFSFLFFLRALEYRAFMSAVTLPIPCARLATRYARVKPDPESPIQLVPTGYSFIPCLSPNPPTIITR